MAAKYQILFNDVDGNACKVTFDFADWTGDVKDVLAAGDPVTINYNGDRTNLFQQVVTSKAVIRVVAQEDFVLDTRDIDDREVSVTIETPAGKWIGFLVSYQRSEIFDSGNYDLEVSCVDAFSYIKENANRILSDTLVMGAQSLNTIISAIVGLPTVLQIAYKPVTETGAVEGNLFDLLFILVETFMEGGLLKNGIDIVSSICDLFNCTSFIENGTIYFRQPRALLDTEVKEIGCKDEGYKDFLIDQEEVTRTVGVAQLGVKHDYGNIGGNIIFNNFFYYYKGSAAPGSEFPHWQFRTDTLCTVTRSLIQRDNSNGVFINGLVDTSDPTQSVDRIWGTGDPHTFLYAVSDFVNVIEQPDDNLNGEYYLRIKYRYHRYALQRTTDPIKYAFRVFAIFADGTKYTFGYDGDGGRTEQHSAWSTNTDSSTKMPLITFPLAASNSESTFELNIICRAGLNFPVNKVDDFNYQFMVVLYPITPQNTINQMPADVIPNSINITEVSIMPNIYTMSDLNIDRKANPARNRVDSSLFTSEECYTLSNRKFKTVNDPITAIAGRKIAEGADTSVSNPVQYSLKGLDGVLMSSITRGTDYILYQNEAGMQSHLVKLNAKDRMYFLRNPRNQITVDIRSSSLKFSDILSFPGYVNGKYVQMESEYRVADCEHTVTVQELSGEDTSDDIIETFLSSE